MGALRTARAKIYIKSHSAANAAHESAAELKAKTNAPATLRRAWDAAAARDSKTNPEPFKKVSAAAQANLHAPNANPENAPASNPKKSVRPTSDFGRAHIRGNPFGFAFSTLQISLPYPQKASVF